MCEVNNKLKILVKPSLYLFLLLGICLLLYGIKNSKLISTKPTIVIYDKSGNYVSLINESQNEDSYGFWEFDEIPERIAKASIALEDKRFWNHPGIDPIAIIRALFQNISKGIRFSGASTIAMQIARMQKPNERTYVNKMIESVSALCMTIRWGREAILKHYLKIAPYGNQCHGINFASRYYFDKPSSDLSWAEIAFLSALPKAPTRMNPFTRNGKKMAIERGFLILRALKNNGDLSEENFFLAASQIKAISLQPKKIRPLNTLHAILKLEEIIKKDYVYYSSLKKTIIFSTMDLKIQDIVEKFSLSYLQKWIADGASNLSVIILDKESMNVIAWLGSSDYFNSDRGAIDFNNSKRSPGSSLKPFIYAHAFERGVIAPNTILYDTKKLSIGIDNADMYFLGAMLPRQALANSRNIPAINLVKAIGIDELYLFLRNIGLHNNLMPAEYYGYGIAIGTLPVNLESLMCAYGMIANDGIFKEAKFFNEQRISVPCRIMSSDISRLITLYLADPLARLPSFQRMGSSEYPFPVAIKTGTSQGCRDAWAVAYSKKFIVGVWVGRPDGKSMNELGGYSTSAALVQKILFFLHKDEVFGFFDLSFLKPEGYEPVEICSTTGKPLGRICESIFTEWLPKEKEYTTKSLYGMEDLIKEGYLNNKEKKIKITINSPENGINVLINPDYPYSLNTLALRATTEPKASQIVWYVDGRPFKITEPSYDVRWNLKPGRHAFQVYIPLRQECSEVVEINVIGAI
ncbi:MAG: transglycosylase domain-containing protein [Desulfobacterales bacterium]|nr:transglycosylase domain-containing protein [Desulfobacterales bacterium]